MDALARYLGRYPRHVTAFILICFVIEIGVVTDYIENTVWPRRAEAHQARIASDVATADKLFTRKRFSTALNEYRFVLDTHGPDLSVAETGRLKDAIGLCHFHIAARRDKRENLARAIAAFGVALGARALESQPAAYAETQIHLGEARRALASAAGAEDIMAEAMAAYREALKVYTAETDPAGHATAQRLLGDAYLDLQAIAPEDSNIDRAFAYFETALSVLDPAVHAEEIGLTLLARGRAFVVKSDGRYRKRHLEEAIKTFEKALSVLVAEKFPRHYGLVHQNIGDAYTLLTKTRPKSRSGRARHLQRTILWNNRAKQAYRIATNFGAPGLNGAIVDDGDAHATSDADKK